MVFTFDLLLFSLITTSSDKVRWQQNVTKKQKGRKEKDHMSEISDWGQEAPVGDSKKKTSILHMCFVDQMK